MMPGRWAVLGGLLVFLPVASVRAQVPIPRELEIELAESALPDYLRTEATVYVFEPGTGMVVARKGTNGFHAFVSRVEPALYRGNWAYTAHPQDVLLPIAFDAAGVDGPMRPFFDAAKLLAMGATPTEMKEQMRRKFDTHVYPPARRSGVAFMLAPVMRGYPNPVANDRVFTVNVPHRMFYAPFVTNTDIGGNTRAVVQPYVIQPGVHGYIGQRAGPAEVERINAEYADLVRRLCALHDTWCLDQG